MGGQAVIEGVLMRSRTGYAVGLRRSTGAIIVRQVPYQPLARKWAFLKLPIIRGAVALVEMMAIGTRSLRWSAEEFEKDLARQEANHAGTDPHGEGEAEEKPATNLPTSAKDAYKHAGFVGMILLSLAIVVLMVVIAPNVLTTLVGKLPVIGPWLDSLHPMGFAEENTPIVYNLIAGSFRAMILFLYVWVISWNSDIKRVFEYHGAEHKAVLALEEGREVTVARAQAHDTLHPRCGTTFIAVVVFVSIVFFALIAAFLSTRISGFPDFPYWEKKLITFGSHILALPLVAGTAFELMKFCARRPKNPICAAFLWPGYKFQRITTRPPDDTQVEVAIVAMLAALAIPTDMKDPAEYVVRGLEDDESSPAYKSKASLQEAAI